MIQKVAFWRTEKFRCLFLDAVWMPFSYLFATWVPNDVALNHSGQSRTERFVCISCADGKDFAVTVKFRVHELRRWNRFRGNCSVYLDYRRLASGAHVRRMQRTDVNICSLTHGRGRFPLPDLLISAVTQRTRGLTSRVYYLSVI